MADSSSVVVCGVLCFIQNKIGYVPSEKLGEVVSKGFEEEEVVRAKDLIFEAASHVSGLRNVRKKVRKNTGTKNKIESDVDDILHLCYEADRAKAELPRFAAVDINTFPHPPRGSGWCNCYGKGSFWSHQRDRRSNEEYHGEFFR